jgi:hypothetical protein
MQQKKRRGNWSSLIGSAILILVFAGGPLLRIVRQMFGGSITLPSNLANLIPIAFAALVVLSIAVSVVRALGSANRGGDARLPTGTPPFGGPNTPMPPPVAPRMPQSVRGGQPKLPSPPRFEPVINPRIVVVGVVGLALLGALGVVVLGISLP